MHSITSIEPYEQDFFVHEMVMVRSRKIRYC